MEILAWTKKKLTEKKRTSQSNADGMKILV